MYCNTSNFARVAALPFSSASVMYPLSFSSSSSSALYRHVIKLRISFPFCFAGSVSAQLVMASRWTLKHPFGPLVLHNANMHIFESTCKPKLIKCYLCSLNLPVYIKPKTMEWYSLSFFNGIFGFQSDFFRKTLNSPRDVKNGIVNFINWKWSNLFMKENSQLEHTLTTFIRVGNIFIVAWR